MVVGAGPAGLEAAWVAAARGHRVTLLGASPEAGGKLRAEALLPGRAEMGKVIAHQLRLAERHGVRIALGARASARDVLALDPAAIVLATGAEMRAPELEVDAGASLSAREYAVAPPASRGGTAVLYDHDHTAATYALAEALAGRHARVVLLTPRTHIAQAVNYCSAIGVHRRLRTLGVEIVTGVRPTRHHDGRLVFADVFSAREGIVEDVACLVYATPRRVTDDLAGDLEGSEVHLVGDCMAPRNLMIAIHEGHALGSAL